MYNHTIFCHFFKKCYISFVYGPIVYRLGHRLFKAVSRVRLPVGSPVNDVNDVNFKNK